MAHIRPHLRVPLRAEIPHEQPHRPARTAAAAAPSSAGVGRCAAGADHRCARIGIGDHDIGRDHARRPSGALRCARPDSAGSRRPRRRAAPPALIGRSPPPWPGRSPRPRPSRNARRIRGLEMADQRVHRGDVERIPADEERMKRQRHAQPRIAHAPGRMGMDRAVRPQPGKGRQHRIRSRSRCIERRPRSSNPNQ